MYRRRARERSDDDVQVDGRAISDRERGKMGWGFAAGKERGTRGDGVGDRAGCRASERDVEGSCAQRAGTRAGTPVRTRYDHPGLVLYARLCKGVRVCTDYDERHRQHA